MDFLKRYRVLLGIIVFLLFTVPAAIDMYWDLYEKIKGTHVSHINFGWWVYLLPIIGLILAIVIIWQGRSSKSSVTDKVTAVLSVPSSVGVVDLEAKQPDTKLMDSLNRARVGARILLKLPKNTDIGNPLIYTPGWQDVLDTAKAYEDIIGKLEKIRIAHNDEHKAKINSLIKSLQEGLWLLRRYKKEEDLSLCKTELDINSNEVINQIDDIFRFILEPTPRETAPKAELAIRPHYPADNELGLLVYNKTRVPVSVSADMTCKTVSEPSGITAPSLTSAPMVWDSSGSSKQELNPDAEELLKLCQIEGYGFDDYSSHWLSFYKIESGKLTLAKFMGAKSILDVEVKVRLNASLEIEGQREWVFYVSFISASSTLAISSEKPSRK